MPYIDLESRKRLARCTNMLALLPADGPITVGELNFVISMILHNYLIRNGLKYQRINEVIGVLECAKLELYRRVAGRYEDKKQLENGPVSELDDDSHERIRG